MNLAVFGFHLSDYDDKMLGNWTRTGCAKDSDVLM